MVVSLNVHIFTRIHVSCIEQVENGSTNPQSCCNSRGGHNPLHASKPTTHTQNHLNKTNTVIHQ
jgi:hypothetical protein